MSTDVTAKTPAPAPPPARAAGGRGRRPAPAGAGRHAPQHAAVRHADRPRPDRGAVPVWTDGDLLLPRNVSNLVLQNSYILILAIGMMLVIIAGHIDLSVGSLAAFVGAMAAVLMVKHDMPWPLARRAVPADRARPRAPGRASSSRIVGIPSFIVTLAGMLLFRGLTEILLEGQSLGPFPDGLQKVANGFLPEVGPNTNYHNLTLLLGLAAVAFVVFQECPRPAAGSRSSRSTCCRSSCSCSSASRSSPPSLAVHA